MNKIRELTLKEVTSSIPDLRQCASLEILRLGKRMNDGAYLDHEAARIVGHHQDPPELSSAHERLRGGFPQLPPSIRVVDLFNCQNLTGNVPDMSENINLERMKLKCCYSLTGRKDPCIQPNRVHSVLRFESHWFRMIFAPVSNPPCLILLSLQDSIIAISHPVPNSSRLT
jgi:hypothetical protein